MISIADYDKYQSHQQELYADVKTIVGLFPSRKYLLSNLAVLVDPLDATQEFTGSMFFFLDLL